MMETELELYLPFRKDLITQGFSENANVLYASQGLIGHTSIDFGAPYGSPILNCADNAYCYSVLNRENPSPSKYRAVFTIVETKGGVYEVSYGHCNEITAVVGKTYRAGEVLATVGNTGTVFSGGREVGTEEKLAGSTAGAHLHGPQVRVLEKVSKRTGRELIRDGNGVYRDKNGFYYEVVNYRNGTNGCVDPAQFFNGIHAKDADLTKSRLHKLVGVLQRVVQLLTRQK